MNTATELMPHTEITLEEYEKHFDDWHRGRTPNRARLTKKLAAAIQGNARKLAFATIENKEPIELLNQMERLATDAVYRDEFASRFTSNGAAPTTEPVLFSDEFFL